MTAPRFTAEVHLGHILQLITMLLVLGVGWGVHVTTVNALREKQQADAAIVQRHEIEIRGLDKSTTVVLTKLETISSDLREVKAEVKKQ